MSFVTVSMRVRERGTRGERGKHREAPVNVLKRNVCDRCGILLCDIQFAVTFVTYCVYEKKLF